jgi:hypothetical protein
VCLPRLFRICADGSRADASARNASQVRNLHLPTGFSVTSLSDEAGTGNFENETFRALRKITPDRPPFAYSGKQRSIKE